MNIETTSSGHTLNYHHHQQNEIATPIGPPPVPRPANLPRSHLLAEENREDYINICLAFEIASIKGDWKTAEAILHRNPELIRCAITEHLETPLQCVAATKNTKSMEKFVEILVSLMNVEDLELQNKRYKTALSFAASEGNVEIAKIMLKKNRSLLQIPDINGMMPIHVAADYKKHDMVRYLYDESIKMTTESWTPENRGLVLKRCVLANFFDFALQIVNDHPDLISNKRILGDVLLVLAEKTDALKGNKPHIILRIINPIFSVSHVKVGHAERESNALKLLRILKEKIVRMTENEFKDILQGPPLEIGEGQYKKTTYPSRLLFVAAKNGNTRFILELIQLYSLYPDLLLMVDVKGRSIFHIAVKYRDAEIYNLLYEIGPMKELITHMKDFHGNNLLHIVAKSGKPKHFADMVGPPLQMEQELLWFNDVKQMMPPAYIKETNDHGETPHELFTRKQHHLAIEYEMWVKDTVKPNFVGATILAFSAASTLHSVYNHNHNSDLPMFYQKPAFIVFVIADVISLIFSSTAVLIFMSILKSLSTEHALRESLPKKQMLGLATIFLSLMTMSVAFNARLLINYNEREKWIPIMLAGFTGMVILFLGGVFYSMYGSRHLFKPKKHMS